jgi:HD-like signal output (HDOD) protein
MIGAHLSIVEKINENGTVMPNRKEVFISLQNMHQLPTPSPTAIEIMKLCRSDTSSLDDIAQLVQVDPTLSAEILKYANSAFLATGAQVASVQRAAVKLGMQTISRLALCLSLFASNRQGRCRGFDYSGFWSASLARAVAGKALARRSGSFDPDELFSCALLSHMGELVLASIFPEEYEIILNEQTSAEERRTMERLRFDIDSAELAAELFLDWGLPAPFALAAAFHEELETSELGESTTRKAAELLHLACRISLLCQGFRPAIDWFEETETMAAKLIGTTEKLSTVVDAITSQWQEWGKTFALPTRSCPPYDEIRNG